MYATVKSPYQPDRPWGTLQISPQVTGRIPGVKGLFGVGA